MNLLKSLFISPKPIEKDLIPSDVISALLEGIETYRKNPKFTYSMSTYGGHDSMGIKCYGCIATTTIFSLMKTPITPKNVHPQCHPRGMYTKDSIIALERAVNAVRLGRVEDFLNFWDIHYQTVNRILALCQQVFNGLSEEEKLTNTSFHHGRYSWFSVNTGAQDYLDAFVQRMTILKDVLEREGL